MTGCNLDKILEVARDAASLAGHAVTEARATNTVQINFKGEQDLVTSADLLAEKIIIERIRKSFPDHAFLSEEFKEEERAASNFDRPIWILDPIDGTTNYAHGHLQVGISIAFMDKRAVQVGVVHSPFQNETFWAVRDKGAYLNGNPIKPSTTERLKSALMATGFPYDRSPAVLDQVIRYVRRCLENCRDVRRVGAGSLDICWVACGRLDGFYETLSAWDIAAACLIAREAGLEVSNLFPPPADSQIPPELYGEWLVVANAALMPQIKGMLA